MTAGRPPDKPVWPAPGETSVVRSNQERTQYLRNAYSQRDNHIGETSYSACVVYTKTIIHLSAGVGERDGYLIKLTIDIVEKLFVKLKTCLTGRRAHAKLSHSLYLSLINLSTTAVG